MGKELTGTILAEYMQRIDAGESVDVEAICSAHPEIADDLRSYVAGAAMVENLLYGDASQLDLQQRETLKPGAAHATECGLTGQMFGRYKVERQLGEGAMGAVYLAHDKQLDRPVALKIPKLGYGGKEEFLARFQREAQAAAKLNHPGICPVFDFGELNGRPYITMAYIDGQPLSRFVGTTPVNQGWIVEVVKQVADALQQAHQRGVVHRDLKPGNVLIDKNGRPIVTDFGLARKIEQNDESRITQEGAILGTPGYMSPEQVEGNQSKIGPATDIYALGVLLFELLTGELPFRGSIHTILAQIARDEPRNPQQLNPDAHPKLCALSLEMMSKEIKKRPASMQAIVDRLSNWATEPSPEERADQNKKIERLQKLETGKQKVADFIKQRQYAQAIRLLENMSSITDADAIGYASWAREELKRVRELPKKIRDGIPSLVATAKQLIEKYDYAQAAELLQQIPLEMRTPKIQLLTKEAIDLQEEVDLLLIDLHECVRKRQYDGIEGNVKRLLKLKPSNHFAKDLWESLQTYRKIPPKQRYYRFDEKGKLLPKDKMLNRNVLIVLLVALISFGGMSYALNIYLKNGNKTLTVKIDEELLANGDVTLTFDGQDHVISGPEFRLTVKPGEYGYEVRQGNSIIQNPQRITVVKDGRNILEIGVTEQRAKPDDKITRNTTTSDSTHSQRLREPANRRMPIDVNYSQAKNRVDFFGPDGQEKGIKDGVLYWTFPRNSHRGGPLIFDFQMAPDEYECEMEIRQSHLGLWWTLPRVGNEKLSHHLKMHVSPAGYGEVSRAQTVWVGGEWKPDPSNSEIFTPIESLEKANDEWTVLKVVHRGQNYHFYRNGKFVHTFTDSLQAPTTKCVPKNLVKLWLLPDTKESSATFEMRYIKLKPLP